MSQPIDYFTGLFLADTTNNPGTVTLPLVSERQGRTITIKDAAGTSQLNPITIQTTGSDVFENGATTLTLSMANSFTTVTAGSNALGNPVWYITGGNHVSTLQTDTLALRDGNIVIGLTLSSGYLLANGQFISTNYNSNFPTSFSGKSLVVSSLFTSTLTVTDHSDIGQLNVGVFSTIANPAFSSFQLFDLATVSSYQTISISSQALFAGNNPVLTGTQVIAPEYFTTSSLTVSSLVANSLLTSYRFPTQTIHFSQNPFSPSSILKMAAWFDAADPSTIVADVTSNISQWSDKSPFQQHLVQPTSANQPLYTPSNTVQFNSTLSQYLSNSYPNTYHNLSSFSLFTVLDTPDLPAGQGILTGIPAIGDDYSNTGGYSFDLGSGIIDNRRYFLLNQFGNPNTYGISNTSNLTTPLSKGIYEFVIQGNLLGSGYENAIPYASNVSSTGGSLTPASPQGILIGGRILSGTLGSPYFNGNMYELLLYNQSLSDTDRQRIEGYLAWKWNLQTSLPFRHPYRFVNP